MKWTLYSATYSLSLDYLYISHLNFDTYFYKMFSATFDTKQDWKLWTANNFILFCRLKWLNNSCWSIPISKQFTKSLFILCNPDSSFVSLSQKAIKQNCNTMIFLLPWMITMYCFYWLNTNHLPSSLHLPTTVTTLYTKL